jgi:vacuolar-type H+-ATPase subunit H
MTIPTHDEAIDFAHAVPATSPANHAPVVENLLSEAIELVDTAPPLPLSTSSRINRDELLELLQQAFGALPDELRSARWLLREREEYLQRVRLEGEEILTVARSRAERMVERTEVVKSAEHRAQRLIADAEAEARRMRRETEDFCDARLASLEGILDRTRTVVATGRNRLQGVVPTVDLTEQAEVAEDADRIDLFDQDFS